MMSSLAVQLDFAVWECLKPCKVRSFAHFDSLFTFLVLDMGYSSLGSVVRFWMLG